MALQKVGMEDSGLVGSADWEEYHESGIFSRNTYPESDIIKYTRIRRVKDSGGARVAADSRSFRTRGSEVGPRSQTTIDLGNLFLCGNVSLVGVSRSW